MTRIEGWLFDAYPEAEGMRVWVVLPDGRHAHFLDPWRAPFVVDGAHSEIARAILAAAGTPMDLSRREGAELYDERLRPVLEARVPPPCHGPLVKKLKRAGVTLYNADIHPVQHYHYERGHFPLAFCGFEVEGGRLLSHELRDDPWATDYALPPLRALHLALAGSEHAGAVNPNHAARGGLVLTHEGQTHLLEGDPADQLETLARRVSEWDPDLITTDWGDSYLIPRLLEWARRTRRPLSLSRDPARNAAGRGGRSFFTYGRTVYQSGTQYLFGRWHLDLKNSFFLKECGFSGLYEIARIAKIPVQRAARTTIGTSLSSMQLDVALRRGLLIPLDKAQPEDFRPASELLVADKGGLVYEPDVGWFQNVAEYDFVSMYPTLMVKHNISPETVNCECCERNNNVPGIGHHLCRKRRGLIPEVLAPILEKRAAYKRLAKNDPPRRADFKARAAAHKWVLVCCFGYLGFKNARFGKIEAHESVTAWGREILLRAKDLVEARGLRVLHGNVDSLWIQSPPGLDHEELRRAIERETGCPVGLEGVYPWLRFCPSKVDPESGVPNRYFGAFENGELKIRGLALRRRDTPPLFARMQNDMLRALSQAKDVAECRALLPRLEEIAGEVRARIAEGRVEAPELAVTFHLSRDPSEYVSNGPSAVAARRLAASGVALHAGETVKYLIGSAGDKVVEFRAIPLAFISEAPEWDTGKYLELWDRARREIVEGLGGEKESAGDAFFEKKGRAVQQFLFYHNAQKPRPKNWVK